jgi:predicted  nucleic acid-binding Zn-ribbon protein
MDEKLKAVESLEELKEYINEVMQNEIDYLESELDDTKNELQDLKDYTENLEEGYDSTLQELPDLETKVDAIDAKAEQAFEGVEDDIKSIMAILGGLYNHEIDLLEERINHAHNRI